MRRPVAVDAGASHRFEDLDCAGGVGEMGRHRIGDRTRYRRAGGEVDHSIGPGHHLIQRVRIENRALNEVDTDTVDIGPVPRGQVVEDDNVVPPLGEMTGEIRTDEAGAAGDEHSHIYTLVMLACDGFHAEPVRERQALNWRAPETHRPRGR